VRAVPGHVGLIDRHCVGIDHAQASCETRFQLSERRHATPIAFDGSHLGTGFEQGIGQATGTGTNLVDFLALHRARDCSDAGQELAIQDEVLTKRLACPKAMAGDDVTQWLGSCAIAF